MKERSRRPAGKQSRPKGGENNGFKGRKVVRIPAQKIGGEKKGGEGHANGEKMKEQ